VIGGWGLDTQAVSIPFHKPYLKTANISQNFTQKALITGFPARFVTIAARNLVQ
jgi:hypothetical protein